VRTKPIRKKYKKGLSHDKPFLILEKDTETSSA
jgi:hypothetical protein